MQGSNSYGVHLCQSRMEAVVANYSQCAANWVKISKLGHSFSPLCVI